MGRAGRAVGADRGLVRRETRGLSAVRSPLAGDDLSGASPDVGDWRYSSATNSRTRSASPLSSRTASWCWTSRRAFSARAAARVPSSVSSPPTPMRLKSSSKSAAVQVAKSSGWASITSCTRGLVARSKAACSASRQSWKSSSVATPRPVAELVERAGMRAGGSLEHAPQGTFVEFGGGDDVLQGHVEPGHQPANVGPRQEAELRFGDGGRRRGM